MPLLNVSSLHTIQFSPFFNVYLTMQQDEKNGSLSDLIITITLILKLLYMKTKPANCEGEPL